MGRMVGGGMGAIPGGLGGGMSRVESQSGTWRQPPTPAEQSHVHVQAAFAGKDVATLAAMAKTIVRVITSCLSAITKHRLSVQTLG